MASLKEYAKGAAKGLPIGVGIAFTVIVFINVVQSMLEFQRFM